MTNRVEREAEAYNTESVFCHSSRLQSRFWHVFSCPNSLLLEEYFEKVLVENTPNSTVLDYGCLNGNLCNKYQNSNQKV